MLSGKKLKYCLLCLIIFGLLACFMSYNSFIYDKKVIDSFDKDVIKIAFYNQYINRFNYLHGLWIIPTGLFFVFLLVLLEVPNLDEIERELIKQIKNKKKEIKSFRKHL